MFCPRCGAQIPDGATFCTKCGNQLPDGQRQAGSVPPAPAPRRRPKAPLVAALVAVVVVAGVVVAGMLTNWFGLAGSKWPAGTYLLQDGTDQSIILTVEEDGRVSFTQTGYSSYYYTGEGTIKVQDGSALIEVDDVTGSGGTVPSEMAFVVPTDAAAKGEIEGDWAMLFVYEGEDAENYGITAGQLAWANVDGRGNITLRNYSSYTGDRCDDILETIHEGDWHDDADTSYSNSGSAVKVGDDTYDCYDEYGDYVLTASYEKP